MFRKPRREPVDASLTTNPDLLGRPPTPPSSTTPARKTRAMPAKTESPSSMPLLGAGQTRVTPSNRKSARTPLKSKGNGGNGNIITMFKKAAEKAEEETSIFMKGAPMPSITSTASIPVSEIDTSVDGSEEPPEKKRRLSPSPSAQRRTSSSLKFGDDPILGKSLFAKKKANLGAGTSSNEILIVADSATVVPSLLKEQTSYSEWDKFADDDYDEFDENGEEYRERRWMQEQRKLEQEHMTEEHGENVDDTPLEERDTSDQEGSSLDTCPICSTSLQGISNTQISVHVNRCLDGEPLPLPSPRKDNADTGQTNLPSKVPHPSVVTIKREETEGSLFDGEYDEEAAQREAELEYKIEEDDIEVKDEDDTPQTMTTKRFNPAAIPRPGQENPFTLDPSNAATNKSAFSKIMSSHAEDEAWATAAANETAARGKPAFKRTCPFYKILPGFSICVDAFRYGAVAGCNAYFLSHFHSDHYIGLTSSWCHGPIFCSHVTANLVRQSLRVDKRWVVDLEFDVKVEVPNTNGVFVTMLDANHCPGSSLFLFEKLIKTGSSSRTQRVLHCGDFRACKAHLKHPLLRPDIADKVSGKEQKLDVVYLDTTYLTPKYAFPSQKEVITACADMCVSLSSEFIDSNDEWERTKRERAGLGMVKFIKREDSTTSNNAVNTNAIEAKASEGETVQGLPNKKRGRLLVIVGTYSIGKERICIGVAKALKSKIYAAPGKQKICAALEDPELNALLTTDPLEAQVHMQMLMEIRAETLADYLTSYKPHFSRIVGFRPSGWNYRPPNTRFVESPSVQTVLYGSNWKSHYTMAELVPQRGSTREASCFGVPYSEHSSFRELSMFICGLNVDKVIPTVNVGSAKSRERMKVWIERWQAEKKKSGLFTVEDWDSTSSEKASAVP